MIPWDEAYSIALNAARRLGTEQVALPEALGRVLAEPVVADMDMPPFDKAIVDGYACRRSDLSEELELIEVIAAGAPPERSVGVGQCAKVMTGGMIPEGVDCVFMVERSEELDANRVRWTGSETADNIAMRAVDIRTGDPLIEPGHRVSTADIAVLASMGSVTPLVSERPRVGVIATGNELVEPDLRPELSQIRNSNAYQLCGQVEAMGAVPSYHGIATDDDETLDRLLDAATAENDVVLLSGGVSMGDFDLVPGALKRQGFDLLFDKVAIQPGKPTVFGVSDTGFCFGLPGNPVSTYVIFELLVKPFLFKLMGHSFSHDRIVSTFGETFVRKAAGRKAWVPVVINESGKVMRIPYHGSAHINALTHAQGLTAFPEGVHELAEGSSAEVLLLRS